MWPIRPVTSPRRRATWQRALGTRRRDVAGDAVDKVRDMTGMGDDDDAAPEASNDESGEDS